MSRSIPTMSSREYIPQTEELNYAIKVILQENSKLDWKHVEARLKKDKPTWKIPPRRISKFVKRQKAGNPINDDEKSTSSRSLRRIFSSRRNNKGTTTTKGSSAVVRKVDAEEEESVTTKQEDVASLQPASTADTEASPNTVTSRKSVDVDVTAPPMQVVEKTLEAAGAYVDDNDGQKEGGCFAMCVPK